MNLDNVSVRTLRLIYDTLLPEYEAAKQEVTDARNTLDAAQARLAGIENDMAVIKAAIDPTFYVLVPSETHPDVEYTVSHVRSTGEFKCSCPAFVFNRGLINGMCKHIREAINYRGLLD
jgi:hypothetical protein